MKLIKKLLFSLTLCAVAVSANADTSMPALSLPNDWQERLYAGASGGYIQSRDFDGGGGHISLGYELAKCHYGTHNVEFEVGFLFETASNTTTVNAIDPYYGPYSNYANMKVDFDQYPLMFNYRFVGNFGDALSGFIWYGGAGLGVNIVNYNNKFNNTFTIDGTPEPIAYSQNKTEGEFAAQAFIGVGYEVTENVAITLGGRIFGTTQYTFSAENTFPEGTVVNPDEAPYLPNQLKTDTIHWMVEAGVTWMF